MRPSYVAAAALFILAAIANPALAKKAVHCGNGFIDQQFGEQCDGSNLNGQTCGSRGFGGGTLACTSSCKFETSGCFTCGNGTIENGEICDGSNLNGESCVTQGFTGGTLACNGNCTFNTGGCTADTCSADLATCNSDLGACNAGKASCQSDLGTCNAGLATCNSALASCQSATCGNGVAEFGEPCDGENLQGETCQTKGYSYGKLACAGCAFDTSACTDDRFVDNGDETITDHQTGLMWEKKMTGSSSSTDSQGVGDCLHCVGDEYAWGTAMSEWISVVNGPSSSISSQTGFAGHTDWRLATIVELLTIRDASCGSGSPCIDSIFGPTASSVYWSSTTSSNFHGNAPFVNFDDEGEIVISITKTEGNKLHVRAVRTGP